MNILPNLEQIELPVAALQAHSLIILCFKENISYETLGHQALGHFCLNAKMKTSSNLGVVMQKVKINLIYASSRNGVIGRDNTLPWHLPEDMEHFKACTSNFPVVMGRKTWESLPPKFRPLPNRVNIVITHSEQWQASGTLRADSIEEAIELVPDASKIWVIGGAQIYEMAMPYADQVYVTLIEETYEGDTYAPELAKDQWQISESSELMTSSTGLKYKFVVYNRIAQPHEKTFSETSEKDNTPPTP